MSNTSPHLERVLGEADRLQRLAYSILRDAHGAEDVAQEASLIALDRAPAGLDEGSFRAWIGAVGRNLARNRVKRERSRGARELESARPEAQSGPSDSDDRLEAQEALAAAVLGLDADERHMVVLRYFDELPPREIAERTGRTPAAVSSSLHRSLQKLRKRMASDGYGASALVLVAGGTGRRALAAQGVAAGGSTLALVLAGWGVGAAALALVLVMAFQRWGEASEALQPGDATLVQSSSGDEDSEVPIEGLAAPAGDARVNRESAVTGGDALAAQASLPTLILQVRVTDPRGQPLAGVAVGPAEAPPVAATSRAGPGFRLDASAASATDQDGTASLVLPWRPDEGRQLVLLVVSLDGWTESVLRETFAGPGEFTLDNVELQRAGSASGRVIDDRGAPVSGCFVGAVGPTTPGSAATERLRREEGQAFVRLKHPAQATFTGEDGAFRLNRIPVGSVSLVAGFEGKSYGYSSPIEIREGEVTRDVVVALPNGPASEAPQEIAAVAPSTALRTMTVSVMDEEGAAIEGAFVSCMAGAGPSGKILPVRPTAIGPGRFELTPPAELFTVIANAREYELAFAGPFELNRAPEALEVTLKRSEALRGVLVDAESKRPLKGVRVHAHAPAEGGMAEFRSGLLTRWRSHESAPLTVTSDDEGRFSLPLAGWGDRLIHAECDGYARATFGPVAIASVSAQREVRIELSRGAILTGRLLVHEDVDPSVYGVEISQGEGHVARAEVGADGSYRFEHLPAGPLQLRRLRRPGRIDLRTRRLRDRGARPEAQVTIPKSGPKSSEVSFDLDYRDELPVELDLQVALDGEWESGWNALLSLDGEDRYGATQSSWVEKSVPADGRLRLTAVGSGEARLTLRRITSSYGEQSLTSAWPARVGVNPRSWSAETGSLRLSQLPVSEEETGRRSQPGLPGFALCWVSADGWEWVERFDPTEAGEQRLSQVPAGKVQIRQRRSSRAYDVQQWSLIGEVDVRAGEEASLKIERGR